MKLSIQSYKIILVSYAITGMLSACENDVSKIPNFRDKRTGLEEGHYIESYLSENSKVKAKLTAPFMYRYAMDTSYVEFPKTLHVDFYDDSLKKESQLDARYGKYREFEGTVYLRDSVVVMNIVKGDTLRCNELWWDQKKQQFYTDKPVHIYQKDKTVFGKYGMEAAQNFSWYTIRGSSGTGIVPKDSL